MHDGLWLLCMHCWPVLHLNYLSFEGPAPQKIFPQSTVRAKDTSTSTFSCQLSVCYIGVLHSNGRAEKSKRKLQAGQQEGVPPIKSAVELRAIKRSLSTSGKGDRASGEPRPVDGGSVPTSLGAGASAGGGGVAPVLLAGRGAADGDQEGGQPQRRRLHRHRRQRRRRAASQGQFFHRPQPPRAPRRRRTARPLHAREGKLSHRSAMHPVLSLFRFWACDLTNSEGVERYSQKESSKHPRN